jgi:ribonuclease HI
MTASSLVLHIHTDGGARGNPGPAAAAFVIEQASGVVVFQAARYLGETTNNMAEYQGVVDALEWLVLHPSSLIVDGSPLILKFFLDSALVVNQLKGLYKVKEPRFIPLIHRIHELIQTGHFQAEFMSIPRAQNRAADKLVNVALDQQASCG